MRRPQSANLNFKIHQEQQIYAPGQASIQGGLFSFFNFQKEGAVSSDETQFVFNNTNTISSQFLGNSSIINRANQRQMVVPKNFYSDQEELYKQLIQLRKEMNLLIQENRKLKTIQSQQRRYIKKVENIDSGALQSDSVLGLKNSEEGSIVPTLKAKIREQNDELDALKEEIQHQHRSVRLTQIREQEQQLKKYQDEVIRLSFLLKNALKINDTDLDKDLNVQERMIRLIEQIDFQRDEILDLKNKQNSLIADLQATQSELQKVTQLHTQVAQDRSHLRKQLDDLLVSANTSQNKKRRDTYEMKLEQYIRESDLLKGEVAVKDKKYFEAQRQYKELQKEMKRINHENQRVVMDFKEQIQKKDKQIEELQDRVYLIDLMKQKNQQQQQKAGESSYQTPKQFVPPVTYADASQQFPDKQADETKYQNAKPVDHNQMKQISTKLRMRLISQGINKDDVKQYLGQNKYLQLKQLHLMLQRFPYYLDEDEGLCLARFLIEIDQGRGNFIEMQAVQELGVIAHRFRDFFTSFEFVTPYKQHKLNKQIRYLWKKNRIKIEEFIGSLDGNLIYLEEFENLMYGFSFDQEQMDYMIQKNFEMTNSTKFVEIFKLRSLFTRTQDDSANLGFFELNPTRYRPNPNITNKSFLKPAYSSKNIGSQTELQSSFVDLKSSEVQNPEQDQDVKEILVNHQVVNYSILISQGQPQQQPQQIQSQNTQPLQLNKMVTSERLQIIEESDDSKIKDSLLNEPVQDFSKVPVLSEQKLQKTLSIGSSHFLSVTERATPQHIRNADALNFGEGVKLAAPNFAGWTQNSSTKSIEKQMQFQEPISQDVSLVQEVEEEQIDDIKPLMSQREDDIESVKSVEMSQSQSQQYKIVIKTSGWVDSEAPVEEDNKFQSKYEEEPREVIEQSAQEYCVSYQQETVDPLQSDDQRQIQEPEQIQEEEQYDEEQYEEDNYQGMQGQGDNDDYHPNQSQSQQQQNQPQPDEQIQQQITDENQQMKQIERDEEHLSNYEEQIEEIEQEIDPEDQKELEAIQRGDASQVRKFSNTGFSESTQHLYNQSDLLSYSMAPNDSPIKVSEKAGTVAIEEEQEDIEQSQSVANNQASEPIEVVEL